MSEMGIARYIYLRCATYEFFIKLYYIFYKLNKFNLNTLITYVCTFIINLQLKQDKIMGELNTKSQKIILFFNGVSSLMLTNLENWRKTVPHNTCLI